ncbi:MAG: PadR family transcriptional regulator [Pirellulales bacterium]
MSESKPNPKRTSNPDFMNGIPELVVLELLARRPMYGYEIVQAIQAESGGVLAFGEGCIYPLLHKLEERGDLSSRRMVVGGRSRVVYRVTPKGGQRSAESAAAWSAIVEAVGNILQGARHERAKIA